LLSDRAWIGVLVPDTLADLEGLSRVLSESKEQTDSFKSMLDSL